MGSHVSQKIVFVEGCDLGVVVKEMVTKKPPQKIVIRYY